MRNRFLSAVLVLSLGACTPSEEARKQRIDEARQSCATYGFQAETSEFAQCVQLETQAAEEKRRAGAAAIADAFSQHGQNMQDIYRQPTRTNCTRGYGGSVNCTSY